MNSWTTSHERVLAQRNAEGWMFLIETARDLRPARAAAPSGNALARALTEPVRVQAPRPLAVLEAGAGAVTASLMSQLPRGSRLDIVEADPRFATQLRHLVATYTAPAGRPGPVTVRQTRLEDLDTEDRYDVIVSGLPLTNFTPVQAERILARYMELLHPGGTLTYFTFVGMRELRAVTASRSEARRRAAVNEIMSAYERSYTIGRRTVWANLRPAHVWHLQRPCVSSGDPQQTRGEVSQ
ncbi:class I SAM-dependent methyltransferase [Streptomyces sp. NBC_00576]|uniref:class I SAM-dependent methyltransferase n=1 Tax=Streptomyces sp. NBC_00576 TaxID=2903665 RepID=UPI002E803C11|nr:translation initiation factor IF-2 [Streptomyces sp. NBC_00576]WUB76584.1 methyltransferase domain-containing protein [Streptomyces sp. NBC_00576]